MVGHDRVHMLFVEDDDPPMYPELDGDGHATRRVVLDGDGDGLSAELDGDWPFNPPFDLYDPDLTRMRIDADHCAAIWEKAGGNAAH
ncbi:hypothetical protein STSO111631_18430 [Stackebrandtia soli]